MTSTCNPPRRCAGMADVAFYVDLACVADGPLAEFAVGNGRVAIPVTRRPDGA